MHKIKKAIAALEGHLGRDLRGIELLRDVTRLANELRRQVASYSESAVSARELAKTLREKASSSETRAEQMSIELAAQRSLVQQKSREIEILKEELSSANSRFEESLPEVITPPEGEVRLKPKVGRSASMKLIDDVRNVFSIFNALRREMRTCPRPVESWRGGCPLGYELGDIIRDLSSSELLKLGRFVASMAMLNFPGIVLCDPNIRDVRMDDATRERLVKPFVAWFFRNNVEPLDAQQIAYSQIGTMRQKFWRGCPVVD